MLKLLISFFLGEATCQPASALSYNERIRPSTMTLEAVSQVRQKKRACPWEYANVGFCFREKGKAARRSDCRERRLLFFRLTLKTACKPYLNKVPRQNAFCSENSEMWRQNQTKCLAADAAAAASFLKSG